MGVIRAITAHLPFGPCRDVFGASVGDAECFSFLFSGIGTTSSDLLVLSMAGFGGEPTKNTRTLRT